LGTSEKKQFENTLKLVDSQGKKLFGILCWTSFEFQAGRNPLDRIWGLAIVIKYFFFPFFVKSSFNCGIL
jgi:hypothetical protein